MTKRLSIALVAVALFVLLVVIMPVSAVTTTNPNGTQIQRGATVFIGEEGLNLTHALNSAAGITSDNAPTLLQIGWWASAAQLTTSSPTKTINLQGGRYYNFQVAPSDFVGYTGNWYLLDATGTTPYTSPGAVMNVQDPSLSVAAWDFQQAKDITGMSITQGEHLGVQVNTNMYAATYSNRGNTLFTTTYTNDVLGTYANAYKLYPNDAAVAAGGDVNYSGSINGSYVFKNNAKGVYSELVSGADVWKVIEYYGSTANTTYGIPSGTYKFAYWNNSSANGNTYTGQNFTVNPEGTISQFANTSAWALGTATGSFALVNTPTEATDGFINIYVKDEAGAKYDKLYVGQQGGSYTATSTTKKYVTTQPWTFGSASSYWVTDAVDTNNQYAYPVGTYSIWAESALNNMKENYKNAGADYSGKTVSATGTVTLISDTVKIEANKDSVVRSKSFSVTVTGKPSTTYYVWVKGTSAMDSSYDNQPPMTGLNQEKVYNDASTGTTFPIGAYQYDNGAGTTIKEDVGQGTFAQGNTFNSTRYYALINTSTSGTRTVEFVTNNWTKAQKYTIRVEQNFPVNNVTGFGAAYQSTGSTVKSDEVDINVEKGAVTIVAAGDQSYYLGEEIKFSGTNTETYKTYLFIVGPNLKSDGSQINKDDPRNYAVETNNASTFKVIDVNGDNTWSWKWGTANYALDAGTYTIYAVSQPYDKESLANAAYGTVSIIIKKPFVSATASQSTVAKGDRVYVTGTAEGDPSSVMIWILGKNYAVKDSASVNSDASFKYEIKQETTKTLSSGQYFVVVQHPMQNTIFDVDKVGDYVVNKQLISSTSTSSGNYTRIFKLTGSGSLQGSDAAEALTQGINDANVDDTYTKLQFLVEEPTIRVDTIGDKHVGDKFTITAQTNLAVDDEILVQVYSSSFKPTQKSQSGEFSGATGTVKVTKGDSGYNKISFDVDSSTFKPDEYIVTEDAVIQEATGTALFNVLETSAVTVAPTTAAAAVTTKAPTQAPTQAPTAVPTATATKSPGFGALIALIGLGAVAFVVVRRN